MATHRLRTLKRRKRKRRGISRFQAFVILPVIQTQTLLLVSVVTHRLDAWRWSMEGLLFVGNVVVIFKESIEGFLIWNPQKQRQVSEKKQSILELSAEDRTAAILCRRRISEVWSKQITLEAYVLSKNTILLLFFYRQCMSLISRWMNLYCYVNTF